MNSLSLKGHSSAAGICSHKWTMIVQKERVSDLMWPWSWQRKKRHVTRKEFAVPVQGHSALAPVWVSNPVPTVILPTVTLPEPTCSTCTLTHHKHTSGATPGRSIFNTSRWSHWALLGLLQVTYMHSLKPCITFTAVCFWLIKPIEFWILTAVYSALSCSKLL